MSLNVLKCKLQKYELTKLIHSRNYGKSVSAYVTGFQSPRQQGMQKNQKTDAATPSQPGYAVEQSD